MLKRVVTSLSPNAERDDVRLATSLLCRPWRWRHGSAVAHLEHALGACFDSHAISFESGRSALTATLQALELAPHSEVLLQAFTCVAVPNSVRWAGHVPVYVDVDPTTFTLDPATLETSITAQTRAIIVQHTFGIPADMEAIMALARRHNLVVIEDCAHGFSSRWKRQLLGTFGDAAIFSFGRDKALSSVFGGVAITRRAHLAARLRDAQSRAPLPSLPWIAQQLFHPLALTLALQTYDVANVGKYFLEIVKRLRLISKAVTRSERSGARPSWSGRRMPNALAILALHQWKKRERFDAHRRRLAALYASSLDPSRVTLPTWSAHADPVLLRYPIRARARDRLFALAKRNVIQLGDWYTSPLAPEGVDEKALGYARALTPNASMLAQETLNLPTHIHISEEDARRIVELICSPSTPATTAINGLNF